MNARNRTEFQSNSGDSDYIAFLGRLLTDEQETWELVNELLNVDNLFFDQNRQKLMSNGTNQCPRTLQIEGSLNNHSQLSIMSIAHWLEKIYEPRLSFDKIDCSPLCDPAHNRAIDFDSNDKKSEQYQRSEIQVLAAIFDLLRGGKMHDA